mgnify:CR=1 FL=1
MDKIELYPVDIHAGLPNSALGYNSKMAGLRYWFIVIPDSSNPYNVKTELTAILHGLDLYCGHDYDLFNCNEEPYQRNEFCIATNNVDVRDAIMDSTDLTFSDINS